MRDVVRIPPRRLPTPATDSWRSTAAASFGNLFFQISGYGCAGFIVAVGNLATFFVRRRHSRYLGFNVIFVFRYLVVFHLHTRTKALAKATEDTFYHLGGPWPLKMRLDLREHSPPVLAIGEHVCDFSSKNPYYRYGDNSGQDKRSSPKLLQMIARRQLQWCIEPVDQRTPLRVLQVEGIEDQFAKIFAY